MIDGNLAMANSIVNETEAQNNYWADVHSFFMEMDRDYKRYPLPICFNMHQELIELNKREHKLKAIAKRFIRIKYYKSI